jgi:hypothetical protein
MAALTLAAAAALAPDTQARAGDKVVVNEVRLDLRVAGLGHGGCDVEVKPGHPGCRFRPVTQHVDSRGLGAVTLKNVESLSADHDCAFAITIKEPGHPDRTVHRGLRLNPPADGRPAATPSLTCYISSPSKLAKAVASRTRR